ncbi:MAG TPA: MBL fold metallo-hydrolase [Syntrophomonadaceae bacterium]|nr:MBL fold metallo-hydrolase [Syntrophomonadaceae bacterium]HQD90031.1 MBL fold metallo-hydrolase [Syntrophomonadaceae bacterium]
MKVSITILVENTTPVPGLMGEFGFSTLIEVNGKRILFDTGSGEALEPNAKALGVDLASVDALVISHGHFDHTGGVLQLLPKLKKPVIYAHSGIFTRHLVPDGSNRTQYIGVPFSEDDLIRLGAQFVAVDDFFPLSDQVYLTGTIPRLTDYEDPGGLFIKEVKGVIAPDYIEDDMALVITHPEGLIIVSGCAHAGIINTINYAMQRIGENKVLAFIGGTHLKGADEIRLQKTIAELKKINPQKLIVCHCTGFTASSRLSWELPAITTKGETGMIFQF